MDPGQEKRAAHLQLAFLYEQAGLLEKAQGEYEQALSGDLDEISSIASEGLQRVFSTQKDYRFRLKSEAGAIIGWITGNLVKSTLLIAAILTLLWLCTRNSRRSGYLLAPFDDYSPDKSGAGLHACLNSVIQQVKQIHTQHSRNRVLSTSENLDLPIFGELDDREDAMTSALAAIDSIAVGNVNLPLGKILLAIRRWFGSHQDLISGSLFQYGKDLSIVAELKNMRSGNVLHVWRVNSGKSGSAIPVMVEELAFRMLQDLCSGLDSKSWHSLQLFTQAIQKVEQYGRDTRELSILEQAAKDLEEAIVLDPGYLRAHYTLGTVYSNLGRHDDARAEFLAVKRAGTQLRLEATYNLGLAYYHKFQDWSYDYAESEFNDVIREIEQTGPTVSTQVLLAF